MEGKKKEAETGRVGVRKKDRGMEGKRKEK